MNRDLESALGELAARAEQSHRTGRAPLPVDLLTARTRRNRRTRAALTVTGAAAASVIVAGAAFALLPDRAPVPPALTPTPTVSSTPTPTPTSTPTPVAVVLPVGNPALPFGTCGSLAGSAPSHPVDEQVRARLTVEPTSLEAGGLLSAGADLESTVVDRALAFAVPDGGPRVAVVKDGVVVGTTGFFPATYDVMAGRDTYEGARTSFRGLLDLTVCDPGDDGPATVGRPLPAGTYELRPWASVVMYDGQQAPAELFAEQLTFEQAAALGGTRLTALGDPTSVTVTGEAESQLPVPVGAPLDRTTFAPVPSCGAPAPTAAPVLSAMLSLEVSPATTTFAAGTALQASATVQYAGPGRLRVDGYHAVEYWIVRDGVVVGTTVQANDAFSPVDLGTGALLGFPDAERVLTSCTGDGGSPLSTGSPLPAGEYTVYPGWIFLNPVVRTPTEVVELEDPGEGYSLTLGTPFTVTLT